MEPESVREDEEKGKYYKFETLKDGRVILKPVRVPTYLMEARKAELRKKQRLRTAWKNRERERSMNRGFVAFVTLALAVCCLVCYLYVMVLTEVQGRAEEISDLQVQLEDLTAENDILESRLTGREDIIAIGETAGALGMTQAQEDQIVYYTVPEEDYMIQYEEIE